MNAKLKEPLLEVGHDCGRRDTVDTRNENREDAPPSRLKDLDTRGLINDLDVASVQVVPQEHNNLALSIEDIRLDAVETDDQGEDVWEICPGDIFASARVDTPAQVPHSLESMVVPDLDASCETSEIAALIPAGTSSLQEVYSNEDMDITALRRPDVPISESHYLLWDRFDNVVARSSEDVLANQPVEPVTKSKDVVVLNLKEPLEAGRVEAPKDKDTALILDDILVAEFLDALTRLDATDGSKVCCFSVSHCLILFSPMQAGKQDLEQFFYAIDISRYRKRVQRATGGLASFARCVSLGFLKRPLAEQFHEERARLLALSFMPLDPENRQHLLLLEAVYRLYTGQNFALLAITFHQCSGFRERHCMCGFHFQWKTARPQN